MLIESELTIFFFFKSTGRHDRSLEKIKPQVQMYRAYFSFASKQSKPNIEKAHRQS